MLWKAFFCHFILNSNGITSRSFFPPFLHILELVWHTKGFFLCVIDIIIQILKRTNMWWITLLLIHICQWELLIIAVVYQYLTVFSSTLPQAVEILFSALNQNLVQFELKPGVEIIVYVTQLTLGKLAQEKRSREHNVISYDQLIFFWKENKH